jgi:hypothetical protein
MNIFKFRNLTKEWRKNFLKKNPYAFVRSLCNCRWEIMCVVKAPRWVHSKNKGAYYKTIVP